jgi:tRNA A-37 threonylcarbamoyl transferase component Bud32
MAVSTYEEFLEDIIEDSVTAKDYLRIGRISEEEFIEVFRALEALIPYVTAFNAAGFYHNDLLGSNIVFDSRTKMAYVIDFERLTSGTGRTDDVAYLRRAIYYLGKTFCAIPKDKLSHGGALTDGICAEIAAAIRPVVAPKNKLAWMKTV